MTGEPDFREQSGGFRIKELLGLFLLFWLFLLVLSLLSFSVEDPSLNHAVNKKEVGNLGGLIGAYISGFLNDLFGTGSLVLPILLGIFSIRCITRKPPLAWWRWTGLGCLTFAGIVLASAVDFHIGDLRGGGMLGGLILAGSRRLLSPFGSTLFWLFVFALGLQLFVNVSWKSMAERLSVLFSKKEKDGAEDEPSGPAASRLFDEDAQPKSLGTRLLLKAAVFAAGAGKNLWDFAVTLLGRKKAGEEGGEAADASEAGPGRRIAAKLTASMPLVEENLPFARAEEGGVPLDYTYAEQYASLETLPVYAPGSVLTLDRKAEGSEADADDSSSRSAEKEKKGRKQRGRNAGKNQEAGQQEGSLLDSLPSRVKSLEEAQDASSEVTLPEAEDVEFPAASEDAAQASGTDSAEAPAAVEAEVVPEDELPDREEEAAPSERAVLFGSIGTEEEEQDFQLDEDLQTEEDVLDDLPEEEEAEPSAFKPEGKGVQEPAEEGAAAEVQPAAQPVGSSSARPAAKVTAPVQPIDEDDEADDKDLVVQGGDYVLPPLALLKKPEAVVEDDEEDIEQRSELLMNCLADFGIQAELVRATPGPVVTTYMLRPARGVSVRLFTRHTEDIARSLMAVSVFVQAPVPGTDTVGIVIPNCNRCLVNFREIASSRAFQEARGALPLIIGKDTTGKPYVSDLARMPHLLVAGATGQGKSVCLNAMLTSLLISKTPQELQLLLVDPKRVEMGMYEDESHLVHPVVKEVSDAKNALLWAVAEMDQRYNRMARLYTKNITGYNEKLASYKGNLPPDLADLEPMPYIVIVIDELADLMLQARKDVEPCIIRLAQLARACGIHMIIATQRPSVDVVTGLIKANFPCRICFRVSARQDSITTLGVAGAEKLLGNGDMFFNPNGGHLTRLHGPYLQDEEVQSVVEFWKKQCRPNYKVDFSTWSEDEAEPAGRGAGRGVSSQDAMYQEVLEFIREKGNVSISLLQRRFNIGYNKAARYMDQLDADGLVGPSPGAGKPRPVLMR